MTIQFEPLVCADHLRGDEIAFDIASCIEEALRKSTHLNGVNAYTGYSARIWVELRLHDMDSVKVVETIQIGKT